MPNGTIKRLMDRGFGFIKIEGEEADLFFHRKVLEGIKFNSLSEGQEVEFEKSQGNDGRWQANMVRLTGTQASDDGGADQSEDKSEDKSEDQSEDKSED